MCIWIVTATLASSMPTADTRFYGTWATVECIEDGRSEKDYHYLAGHEFTETSWMTWGRQGELSPVGNRALGPIVNTAVWPMRVDIRDAVRGGKTAVRPGIFMWAKGRLVVALGPWTVEKAWPAGQDYPSRPKDFSSTKANRVEVWYMKACAYLEQGE